VFKQCSLYTGKATGVMFTDDREDNNSSLGLFVHLLLVAIKLYPIYIIGGLHNNLDDDDDDSEGGDCKIQKSEKKYAKVIGRHHRHRRQ